jgi:glycosyltransferase involved in cell wall biosynthesis
VICNISYRNSPAVFITNTDVLPSVSRLGLEPERVHYLPHAFDDRKLMNWRDAHPELAPPDKEVVFFSPTRQHWTDENRSLTKGNDIMLLAAGQLWREGRRFKLLMVEWGQDLQKTRELIAEQGLDEAVFWVPPMGKQDLWRAYCTSHAVLDQFILPALGGVGFETLALGCRLITRTDQTVLADFFGEAPPVLPAASVEEVAASMRKVLDDPDDLKGTGPEGRQWIDQWHSARRTVSIQAKVYRHLLGHKLSKTTKPLDASRAAG